MPIKPLQMDIGDSFQGICGWIVKLTALQALPGTKPLPLLRSATC